MTLFELGLPAIRSNIATMFDFAGNIAIILMQFAFSY